MNDLPRRDARKEEALRVAGLFLSFLFLTFWFKNEYLLYAQPVHTKAQVLKVTDYAVDYKFYDSLADKTLFFRHEASPAQAKQLRAGSTLDVVYVASNSDIVVVPSLKRPWPVWVFALVQIACFASLWVSVRNWRRRRSAC